MACKMRYYRHSRGEQTQALMEKTGNPEHVLNIGRSLCMLLT